VFQKVVFFFLSLSKSRSPIRATCHALSRCAVHNCASVTCHALSRCAVHNCAIVTCLATSVTSQYLLQKPLLHPSSICLIREDNYVFPNNLTYNSYAVYTFTYTHVHICTCVYYWLWSSRAASHDPGRIKPMCLRGTFWPSVSSGISRIHFMILSVWETLDSVLPPTFKFECICRNVNIYILKCLYLKWDVLSCSVSLLSSFLIRKQC
jgi:hypothetical protein